MSIINIIITTNALNLTLHIIVDINFITIVDNATIITNVTAVIAVVEQATAPTD